MRTLLALLILLASGNPALAALTSGTVWQLQANATSNFVNGAGFDPASANFLTNLSATSANTSSPVVSSASYNFAAGDVGAWVYISSGTNWTPGWCQIASVAANAATLSAGVGACVSTVNANGIVATNTVAGIATVSSPTSGTGGVDYSQQASAQITGTDGTQTAASTTFTVTSETFTPVMAGNLIHITACTGTGCLTGWYEIAQYTDAHNVVLDRTATNGSNAITASTFNVGGAGNFGALEDAFQSVLPAKSVVFVKNGSYTMSGSVSTANSNCATTTSCFWVGFQSLRGDGPTGSNRPTISQGTTTISWGGTQYMRNLIFTGSPTSTMMTAAAIFNTKVTNLTSTASVTAFGGATAVNSELMSLNGTAQSNTGTLQAIGNYYHDSANCLTEGSTNALIAVDNVFEACTTRAVQNAASASSSFIHGNTIYGREGKIGVGINLAGSSTSNRVFDNVLYGLTTGINASAVTGSNYSTHNDFFDNTTDVANFNKEASALALDPGFANETNLTNTGTVSTSGTTLTDSGASFGVSDSVDVLHVLTSTGGNTGAFLITGHTGTTLAVNNSLGTGSSVTYFITHGHNFQIGSNLKGAGFPTLANPTNGLTTSYPDVGAVQRQEPAGGGTIGSAAP